MIVSTIGGPKDMSWSLMDWKLYRQSWEKAASWLQANRTFCNFDFFITFCSESHGYFTIWKLSKYKHMNNVSIDIDFCSWNVFKLDLFNNYFLKRLNILQMVFFPYKKKLEDCIGIYSANGLFRYFSQLCLGLLIYNNNDKIMTIAQMIDKQINKSIQEL